MSVGRTFPSWTQRISSYAIHRPSGDHFGRCTEPEQDSFPGVAFASVLAEPSATEMVTTPSPVTRTKLLSSGDQSNGVPGCPLRGLTPLVSPEATLTTAMPSGSMTASSRPERDQSLDHAAADAKRGLPPEKATVHTPRAPGHHRRQLPLARSTASRRPVGDQDGERAPRTRSRGVPPVPGMT